MDRVGACVWCDMANILVRALRDFDCGGVKASKNEVVDVTPVQAAILGRAHHVNLSETNLRKPQPESRSEPQSKQEAAPAESTVAAQPTRRRTYRRRDRVAER